MKEEFPPGVVANRVQAVGYCDLDDRPASKIVDTRIYGALVSLHGTFLHSGWSIVEVTDP